MSLVVKLVILAVLIAFTSASLQNEYSNSAFLDEKQMYKLYWNTSDASSMIWFAVEVQTTGWVGFGLSPGSGNMPGSDVVIGWVKNGKKYMKDRYASGNDLPLADTKQDYNLTEAYEKDGKTVLKFSRKYDTCDRVQDVKIEKGTARIIFSYHTDDPDNEEKIDQHTVRGSRSLDLLNVYSRKPTLPSNLKHFDITVNASLPEDDTIYYCKPFQMPHLNDEKHHVVKISPIISPGNAGLVHHILVYECRDDFNVSHLGVEGPCFIANMPDSVRGCAGRSVIAAWAIGGTDFYFPNHVGYPIGDAQSVKFVVMEIHYDNPDEKSGITDQSGMRFYYTSTHRKYDAGLLWVGWAVTPEMWIPPKQEKWDSIGYCASACTEAGLKSSPLPGGGVNIFSVFLHSHLLGSKIWVKHIRDRIEYPEIARDEHYDFNYQEARILEKEIRIKPGDDIVTYCRYDSSKRTKLTTGGVSTKEEMCMSFMYYYPRVNFTRCVSRNIGYQKFFKNNARANEIINWRNPEWKKEWDADDLRDAYLGTKQTYVYCEKEKGKPIKPINGKGFPKPVIEVPLAERDVCSSGTKVGGCVIVFVVSLMKIILMA